MSKFEVKNNVVEVLLKNLAVAIQKKMPRGWGFTLMIFDYSDPKSKDAGSMFYISSAQRTDMLKAMMEFIEKQQEDLPKN